MPTNATLAMTKTVAKPVRVELQDKQQLKKAESNKNGPLLQGDEIGAVESLYKKVEDLALAAVLEPPTPLMLSFSLLSCEEIEHTFDAMVSNCYFSIGTYE